MGSVWTRASAAIDRGVARLMERRVAPRALSADGAAEARDKLLELARAYNRDTLGVPSGFFPTPALPSVAVTEIGDGPLGTHVADLAFRSDYQPFLPAARDRYLAFDDNMTAHARWWTSDRGRPTIIVLHGLRAGSHWISERVFDVAYWLRHGYDVIAFQLPFHGKRTPGTGQTGWPSPNPMRTNEGFGHAIYDLRALALFLRARGVSAVGAMGMSLGGYTTALWASIAGPNDPGGIDFAVAIVPAVSLARLMWHHGENSQAQRWATKVGIAEDMLADAFRVHSPTTRPPRVAAERLFVIAGKGDSITPPDQASALAAHWHRDVLWFDGGHLAQLGRGDAIRSVRRALGNAGFGNREFRS